MVKAWNKNMYYHAGQLAGLVFSMEYKMPEPEDQQFSTSARDEVNSLPPDS